MEPARIDATALKKRLDRGEPVFFIDSRSTHAYEESDIKIPGSVRLHFREIEARLDEVPRDRTIVTYCTWENEASSARAAQVLLDHGYKDVFALKGGLNAWEGAGYPVERK